MSINPDTGESLDSGLPHRHALNLTWRPSALLTLAMQPLRERAGRCVEPSPSMVKLPDACVWNIQGNSIVI